jgi:hypothetical protein
MGNGNGTDEPMGVADPSKAIASAGETSVAATAARARARVEARYVIALQRPRDLDAVRVRLLKECKRPGFAEVARYHKPIGKGVTGLSIRFAEAVARHMGNLDMPCEVVFDDDEKRIVRISVTDLETNATHSYDATITKTVERRELRKGQEAVSARTNSYGEVVYLVQASDDDLLNKQNAQISKALRNCVLRLLPGDIADECERLILDTLETQDAKDPDQAKKMLVDSFAGIGVKPEHLAAYLGHPLADATVEELHQLRGLRQAIKDGEATWAAAMEHKRGGDEPAEDKKTAALKKKLEAAKKKGGQQ